MFPPLRPAAQRRYQTQGCGSDSALPLRDAPHICMVFQRTGGVWLN